MTCLPAPAGGSIRQEQAMTSHDHQLHQGDSLKAAARERLTSEGEQWTGMRAAVFDPIHYTMEWKMLRRIKELVEQERRMLG